MPSRRQRVAASAATHPLLAQNAGARPGPGRHTSRKCIRLFAIIALFSLLYLLFFLGSSTPSKHSPKEREPVEGQHIRRIVAVGDLHGDYDNALKVLHMADVVNENGSWTGNVEYFVQTGDIIDRGVDTIKLFKWMETLREQARNAGGFVFSHMGNHEFMNALGDWRYVPQAEIATFGSVEKRQAALSTGFLGAAWAQNYSVASRVPLHPSSGAPYTDYTPSSSASALSHASLSFMHGGLSPVFAQAHGSPYPSAINALGASLLHRCRTRNPQPPPHPPAPYAGLPPDSTPAEVELYGANGPMWYRGWATDEEAVVCSRVGQVMERIGVRRLIMGHTPNFQKIVSRCGGKVIIIDTGISKAYGGIPSALSITYTLTPVLSSFNVSSPSSLAYDASKQQVLQRPDTNADSQVISQSDTEPDVKNTGKGKGSGTWVEREEIAALYPGGRSVQLVLDERQVEGDFW